MYIIRLDDASEYSDVKKWEKIERILYRNGINPIVGIIPNNEDEALVEKYSKNQLFWKKAYEWQQSGWIIAMHGYNHKYISEKGGINPVNNRSEFAGIDLEKQKEKIRKGLEILKKHKINPVVFFAPSHTFDKNTIYALKECSDIRIISDTIANDIYYKDDIFFIPQQSGKGRKLPFKTVTFCYHPNEMDDNDFKYMEEFIRNNRKEFVNFDISKLSKRKYNLYDAFLSKLYFLRKKI